MESKKEKEIPLSNDKEINNEKKETDKKNEINKEDKKTKKNNKDSKKQKNKEKKNENKENSNNNQNNKNEEDQIGLWKCWKEHPPTPIPGSPQLTLMGWSLAALRTNFYIKELGLMLDAGLSGPEWALYHILITHCHSDHCANLPFHLYSYKPPDKIKIFVPKGIERHIKEFNYC